MTQLWLVDGYNAIRRGLRCGREAAPPYGEEGRQFLLQCCRELLKDGTSFFEVYFDGSQERQIEFPGENLKVIFVVNADDAIVARVQSYRSCEPLGVPRVVTSDLALFQRAQSKGASWLRPEQLFEPFCAQKS